MHELAPYVATVVAFIAAFVTAYLKGRNDANSKVKLEKAEANEETHERINEVAPIDLSDRNDIVERLRRRGQ